MLPPGVFLPVFPTKRCCTGPAELRNVTNHVQPYTGEGFDRLTSTRPMLCIASKVAFIVLAVALYGIEPVVSCRNVSVNVPDNFDNEDV